MKVVYAVEWIEVEFGSRPEGYKLFLDKELCVETTKKDSQKGPGADGYFGPVRPLRCVEVPYDSLEDDLKTKFLMSETGFVWTDNNWSPRFRGRTHHII